MQMPREECAGVGTGLLHPGRCHAAAAAGCSNLILHLSIHQLLQAAVLLVHVGWASLHATLMEFLGYP